VQNKSNIGLKAGEKTRGLINMIISLPSIDYRR